VQNEESERQVNIQEIVFPVDFSDRSVAVCPYAAAIARCFGAKLTLVHVVNVRPAPTGASDQVQAADEAETNERVTTAKRSLDALWKQYVPNVKTDTVVLVGDPAEAIVAFAGTSRERIVLMPTHGYGSFRRMLLGSVAAKVLHDAMCPVWTGPHLENAIIPTELFEIKRILSAVSLDWETDEVLKHSGELAKFLGADLTALHVIAPMDEGILPLLTPDAPPLSTAGVEQAIKDALTRTGSSAKVCVSVGDATREVARAASAHKADLVVIGRGGKPEMRGRLGSHAYGIIRRSPCPVLCI
jgi:nucleotide-binding universal stress UspA family protein